MRLVEQIGSGRPKCDLMKEEGLTPEFTTDGLLTVSRFQTTFDFQMWVNKGNNHQKNKL
jgi:hypothetical protein